MRTAFLFLFICLGNCSFAQGDDFPDYRSKKDLFSRLQEKELRSDLASFSMGGIDEIIGKLPLKSVPVSDYGTNYISFAGNNIQATIKASAFEPSKHKLQYYNTKYLIRIDAKPFFGDYGKVPKTYIENVILVVDNDTIPIPPAAYADLYNPVFTYSEKGVSKSYNSIYLSNDGHRIYVYMLKPEAGGSYEVTWIIQDKKYLKRVVDFGFLK